MFKKTFLWMLNKIPRKSRKALLKKISFIKAAKKEYETMDKMDTFKADDGYFILATTMKESVYPKVFEAMERHGIDHVILTNRGLKDFKVDIDGCVNMRTDDGNSWEELGNIITDKWDPMFRVCNSRKNIHRYSVLSESLMDKLDELIENDVKNRALCDRAKRFGTAYERKVITEKYKV